MTEVKYTETIRLRLPPLSGYSYPYTNVGLPQFGTWRTEPKWHTGQLQTNLQHFSGPVKSEIALRVLESVDISKTEAFPICSDTHVSATVVLTVRYNSKLARMDGSGQFGVWARNRFIFYKESALATSIVFSPIIAREQTGQMVVETAPKGSDYIKSIDTAMANILSRQKEKNIAGNTKDRHMTADFMFVLQDVYPWSWVRNITSFNVATKNAGLFGTERTSPFDLGAPRGDVIMPLFCFDWKLFCKYMGVKLNVMHAEVVARLGIKGSGQMQMCVFCMPNSHRKRYNEANTEEFERKKDEWRSASKIETEPAVLVEYLKSTVMPVWFLPLALQIVASFHSTTFEHNTCLMNIAQQLMRIACSDSGNNAVASLCLNRFNLVYNMVYSTRGSFITDTVLKNSFVISRMQEDCERNRDAIYEVIKTVGTLSSQMELLRPIFLESLATQPDNWEDCILNSQEQAALIAYCVERKDVEDKTNEKLGAMGERIIALEQQNQELIDQLNSRLFDDILVRCAIRRVVKRLDISMEEIEEEAAQSEGVNDEVAKIGGGWLHGAAIKRQKIEKAQDLEKK